MERMNDFLLQIENKVTETTEEFIFETISPYCNDVLQRKISKKELEQALLLWDQAKRRVHTYEISGTLDNC